MKTVMNFLAIGIFAGALGCCAMLRGQARETGEAMRPMSPPVNTPATDAVKSKGEDVRVFQLKYAEAGSLAEQLKPFVDGRVVNDSRTNQVIVSGSKSDLDLAATLIEKLDVEATKRPLTFPSMPGGPVGPPGATFGGGGGGGGFRGARWNNDRRGAAGCGSCDACAGGEGRINRWRRNIVNGGWTAICGRLDDANGRLDEGAEGVRESDESVRQADCGSQRGGGAGRATAKQAEQTHAHRRRDVEKVD